MPPDAVLQIEERPHSRVGASSLARVIQCPASAVLAGHLPPEEEEKSSSYALEGTIAHAVFETCLNTNTFAWEWIGTKVALRGREIAVIDETMTEVLEPMLAHVRAEFPSDYIVEQRLELPNTEVFGYVDLMAKPTGTSLLKVADLKYGAGIYVPPHAVQLGTYGLMAMHACDIPLDQLSDTDPVFETTILQPRQNDPIRSHTWTAAAVRKLLDDILTTLGRVSRGELIFKVGDHCRFCPVAAICPQLLAVAKNAALASALPSPEAVLHGQEPAEVLDHAMELVPVLERWTKQVRAVSEKYLRSGGRMQHAKLVHKKTNREWLAPEMAADFLKKHGVEPYKPQDVISPAEAEKRLTPALKAELNNFIHKPVGDITLAPVSDSRPAVSGVVECGALESALSSKSALNTLDRVRKK